MQRTEYKPRIIDEVLLKYLKAFGAVLLEGPRWSGKTWSGHNMANSAYLVADPAENFQNRRLAELSPQIVLEGKNPRLIDEWQEVPPLWDAVRSEVDRRGEKGLFILTGSVNVKNESIIHSGAGRIAKLKMHTMSLYESGDSSGSVSLKELCEEDKLEAKLTGNLDLKKLAYLVLRGGWPANIEIDEDLAILLPSSYVENILDKDIKEIHEYELKRDKMMNLLKSLARNEATTASNRKLIEDMDKRIDEETLSTYMHVLERMFLIEPIDPYSPNVRSSIRIKGMKKRHFADPSLPASLLGIQSSNALINNLDTFGFLFESLVERDLITYASSFGAKVYHYQDYKNREIDAVVELANGKWCAFEIKLGYAEVENAAKGLIKLRDDLKNRGASYPEVLCVISGLSNAQYTRDDGVHVVPITALKN